MPVLKSKINGTATPIGSSVPAQAGNIGKFLTTDGANLSWANVDALPSQTSQSGKFLTTNGTAASWATVDALPSQTSQSGKFLTTDGSSASWAEVSMPSDASTTQSGVVNTTTQSFAGTKTFTNPVIIGDGTASTSTSTGALKVTGGVGVGGTIYATAVYGAVWNDFAEFRISSETEPGLVMCENGDGTLSRSHERLQAAPSVISDTYGFAIGETDVARTPIAVAGRVLVKTLHPVTEYHAGDVVCAAPDGTIDIMTRKEIQEYPDRIVGIVSEIPIYDTWGTNHVSTKGRIWIKVK